MNRNWFINCSRLVIRTRFVGRGNLVSRSMLVDRYRLGFLKRDHFPQNLKSLSNFKKRVLSLFEKTQPVLVCKEYPCTQDQACRQKWEQNYRLELDYRQEWEQDYMHK